MRSLAAAYSASFLVLLMSFSAPALGQELSSYSIDADLKQSSANVKLVFSFSEPVDEFSFLLPFRISDFNATSSAGSVACENQLDGVSLINCKMDLTEDKKTLEMTFSSSDLVKPVQGKFVFSGDFSLKLPVKTVFAAIRLPEGMVLSQEIQGGSTIPFTNSTSTDGRKITVVWRLSEMVQKPVSFQVFYEPGIEPAPSFGVPPLRVLVLLAIMFGGGIALILLKRRKKTQEVIFSVLDDYEKGVISSIDKAGGTVNQKKIVLDTNLSKAKVSRVVQKLVERGLIEVERKGRTNIVRFVKKTMGR